MARIGSMASEWPCLLITVGIGVEKPRQRKGDSDQASWALVATVIDKGRMVERSS